MDWGCRNWVSRLVPVVLEAAIQDLGNFKVLGLLFGNLRSVRLERLALESESHGPPVGVVQAWLSGSVSLLITSARRMDDTTGPRHGCDYCEDVKPCN